MKRRDFLKAISAAASGWSGGGLADNAVKSPFRDAGIGVNDATPSTALRGVQKQNSFASAGMYSNSPASRISPDGFTHRSPLWMKRGNDEYRFDASTPDGYKAAMWLLRDVQANRVGYPHPYLLQMLSRAQVWLLVNSVHTLFDVTSGLRTVQTNMHTEGSAKASLHLPSADGLFFAADFRGKGLDASYTAKLMQAVGAGGIGLYWQRDFVHADIGRPRMWVNK